MDECKRIALVAHDNRKKDLIEWVEYNNYADYMERVLSLTDGATQK
jgi:methylglyoxal synthase